MYLDRDIYQIQSELFLDYDTIREKTKTSAKIDHKFYRIQNYDDKRFPWTWPWEDIQIWARIFNLVKNYTPLNEALT